VKQSVSGMPYAPEWEQQEKEGEEIYDPKLAL
jgi:hypothetical protein